MNKAEILFIDKAIKRRGTLMYSKKDALRFVTECLKQNIILLGIDGFILGEHTTQPRVEDRIDFSMRPFTKDIYDEAIVFLTLRDDSLFFEIVCSD